MNVENVQSSSDDTGIGRQGYETLFKCLREGMVNEGISKVGIPHLFHIEIVHARSNRKNVDLMGDMYHIEAMKEIKQSQVGNKNIPNEITTRPTYPARLGPPKHISNAQA
jgi:hypothetical protein